MSAALAGQGASVVVASRNADHVAAAVKKIHEACAEERASGVTLDLGQENSIRDAVAQTLKRFGRLDVLVNATCLSAGKTFDELGADDFDRTNHTNITGSFLLARAAANAMKSGGSVINYASMYGLVSPVPKVYEPPMQPNPIEYGVAKAALCQMTRYLAAVYGPRGIRVNAVAPGPMPNPDVCRTEPEFVKRLAARTMLGRIGRREETAGAVVFLASDEASYVTGTVLVVDGGWTAW
jgi:NAD(P)-dependent dehydrogenase (short-subunit alcohol dehydrogenase family)